jgi:type IV pilus assembly protein PilQ
VRTESIQLNYQKAEEVKKLLADEKQPLLSKRGTAVVDNRTNMLFIQDTPSRIEDARALIAKIDVPVRQVLIEARIVEASDNFARNLGVRLGLVDLKGSQENGRSIGSQQFTVGGQMATNAYLTGQSGTQPPFSSSYGVNLPAAALDGGRTQTGALSFTLFNAGRTSFVNMELSALEADGRGKVVSSPRVMTADQNEAFIEQGVEIPYLSASSSGATQVQYKKAVLSLKVKPQITPEGKITMKVEINKDSPNTQLNTGAGLALNTKKVKTEVLVDNGGTVVIGGIYEQESLNRTRKIPVLGDIPYLGWMFKNNEVSDARTELMVFLTPRVVSDSLSAR